MQLIPLRQFFRILRAEEDTADTEDTCVHRTLSTVTYATASRLSVGLNTVEVRQNHRRTVSHNNRMFVLSRKAALVADQCPAVAKGIRHG